MSIIVRLAVNRITGKKARSVVICAAILLTMVLFMTVVSIASNLIGSYGLMLRLESGTDYHGYLTTDAFEIDEAELRDRVRSSPTVKEAAVCSTVTRYATAEAEVAMSRDTIRVFETEEQLEHFYASVTEGHFPQSDDELLIDPTLFGDIAIGECITLYYECVRDGMSYTEHAEFVVCGYMEVSSEAELGAVLRYSDTLEESYGFGTSYNVFFTFDNTLNLSGKYDTLVDETLGAYKVEGKTRFGSLNGAYLEATLAKSLNPSTVCLIAVSVALVFFCSFLLIYNVYSIALTQDMQGFGLLSVLGTTRRQLRRIIVVQSSLLYGVTALPGLIMGYLIGWRLLSPVLFTMNDYGVSFKFEPWIPIATLALTLVTLLWSATRPLKKLYHLTPISTVEYTPQTDLPKTFVRRKNYKKQNKLPTPIRLAGYTVSRDRKKSIITAMSMSLSVLLFVLIATLSDYMLAYTHDNLQKTDYIIKPAYEYKRVYTADVYSNGGTESEETYTSFYDIDEGITLAEEYVSRIEESPLTGRLWRIRTTMLELDTPDYTRRAMRSWKERCDDNFWTPIQQRILDGRTELVVVGIPDEFFGQLIDTELEEIGEEYSEGYVVAQYSADRVLAHNEGGYTYAPYSYFEEGSAIRLGTNSYTVKYGEYSLIPYYVCGYISCGDTNRPVLYMTESAFVTEFGEGATYALLLDAADGRYDAMRSELTRLGEDFTLSVDIDVKDCYDSLYAETYDAAREVAAAYPSIEGRLDDYAELEKTVLSIRTVGYSLSGMIFLVGVLNIVNTALSSVTERKREFAMLEAVGMTDRQLWRMLLSESLYSGGIAVVMTLFVGFPVIAILVNTAMDALVELDLTLGVVMLAVCIAVSMLSGAAVLRLTKVSTVVERLDEE